MYSYYVLAGRRSGWQLRLDLLVEMFKRFCYMSKLWDFESQLYQCILYSRGSYGKKDLFSAMSLET